MQRKQVLGAKALTAALAVGVAAAAYAQTRLTVRMNGTVISSSVQMIGGRPFLPLSDVARAYNQTLVKRPGGYDLVAVGGAGEVGDSHTSKIGEELFTGQFKFKVLGIRETSTYTERYAKEHTTVTPDGGETLFVVDCRIKNGTKIKQSLVFSRNETYGNPNTALADDQEHSYPPFSWHGNAFDGYDVHADQTYPDGADVLPGAAIDFALVFAAPPGTRPKDLIFSILKYDERDHAKTKSVDVRVSLTP